MNADFFTSDVLVGVVLLIMLVVMFKRLRGNPDLLKPETDLAYELISHKPEEAGEDFLKTFADDPIPEDRDCHLIRLALLNRGMSQVAATDFTQPIKLSFVEGTEILNARYFESFRSPPIDNLELEQDGTSLTIPPLTIAKEGMVIFNLIVRGAAEPDAVTGSLRNQSEMRRLGLTSKVLGIN